MVNKPIIYAESNSNYAKVKSGCLLFKSIDSTQTSPENVMFEIPESYFVTIISETNANIFKVKYDNFTGFVDSSFITKTNITPTLPTLKNITFAINSDSATQLRSEPSADSNTNVLTTIPANTQNINYIAKISSSVPTGGTSDVWFFAEYCPESNPTSVYYGYVYSERTTNLTPIIANTEADPPPPETAITESDNVENYEIPMLTKIILISAICLPVVILLIISIIKARSYREQSKNSIGQKVEIPIKSFTTNQHKTLKSFKGKVYKIKDKFEPTLSFKQNYKNIDFSALDDEDENLL
ncbi:MAG: hypothetical protein K6F08_01755 [bacterium]|nr:hypothetical protein [bacterium]